MAKKSQSLKSSSQQTTLLLRGQEILQAERQIDFMDILQSKEASVMKLRKENYDDLYDFAVDCAGNFLKLCYPNQIGLAPVIASDLIETRPTWKALDFINLFKFFRQRQDLEGLRVFGNQITIPKLMEMVSVYEQHRAQAIEDLHNQEKGDRAKEDNTLENINPKVLKMLEKNFAKVRIKDGGMGKEFEKVQEERERTGKDVLYPAVSHKKFYEENKKPFG